MTKSLEKRVVGKRVYRNLFADGRAMVRINPALIPHLKRHLAENPSGLNALVNLTLARYFDELAERGRLDAAARMGKGA